MATIRQIARIAGVSPSTVSRALADHPYVRDAVKAQIQEIAQAYHYHPDRRAAHLLAGKSGTIGCLVPSVDSFFFSAVLKGILSSAYDASYQVLTLQSRHDPLHTQRALHAFVEQRVEGLIIATGHEAPIPTHAFLELWSHGIVPVAVDFSPVSQPIDRVVTDEERLADMAVNYLWELGHRHIAYIGPLGQDQRARRTHAITTALRKHGVQFCLLDDDDERGIDRALDQLPDVLPGCSAILAYGDRIAALVMRATLARGIHIPRQLSVLGCGNLAMDAYLTPPLTSIDQQAEEIGRSAVALLLRRMHEQLTTPPTHPDLMRIPPRLILRGSCGMATRPSSR